MAVLLSAVPTDGNAQAARAWLVGWLETRKPSNLGAALATQRASGNLGLTTHLLFANRSPAGWPSADVHTPASNAAQLKYMETGHSRFRASELPSEPRQPACRATARLQRHYRDVAVRRVPHPQNDAVLQGVGKAVFAQRQNKTIHDPTRFTPSNWDARLQRVIRQRLEQTHPGPGCSTCPPCVPSDSAGRGHASCWRGLIMTAATCAGHPASGWCLCACADPCGVVRASLLPPWQYQTARRQHLAWQAAENIAELFRPGTIFAAAKHLPEILGAYAQWHFTALTPAQGQHPGIHALARIGRSLAGKARPWPDCARLCGQSLRRSRSRAVEGWRPGISRTVFRPHRPSWCWRPP